MTIISQEKVDYFDKLSSKEREVIVNKGTEYPNTGKYNKHFKKSNYVHMQGGKALVKWNGETGDSAFLIGGAEYVFNGNFIE